MYSYWSVDICCCSFKERFRMLKGARVLLNSCKRLCSLKSYVILYVISSLYVHILMYGDLKRKCLKALEFKTVLIQIIWIKKFSEALGLFVMFELIKGSKLDKSVTRVTRSVLTITFWKKPKTYLWFHYYYWAYYQIPVFMHLNKKVQKQPRSFSGKKEYTDKVNNL